MPTKKTQAEPATVAESCANCGAPATQKTSTRAANTDYYCDACGRKVYPRDIGELERIDAG